LKASHKTRLQTQGGDWDFEKASHTLLLDYRSGALGRISLETPASREHLLATYVPPVLLGQGKSVQTGMEPEADEQE
jgi:ribosome biogenesis GTPase A